MSTKKALTVFKSYISLYVKNKIAVLFFPKDNFQLNTFYERLNKYNGLRNDPKQWKRFEKIICIQKGTIVYEKSHSLE